MIELAFGVTGLPSAVQATEGDQTPVQEGTGLHEDDPPAQVPGGLRPREGDQGWQPVLGPFWKVRIILLIYL